MRKPAIFMDRDGTVNVNCPYCKNADEIVMFEDIYEPLKMLSKDHYIIIITNQSGVGRKYFTEHDLHEMNEKIRREIAKRGGRIDGVYYCPHLPEEGCECRKPKLGMINAAFKDFEIDKAKSFIVGDKDVDIRLAKAAGMKSIRIRNKTGDVKADFYADDFYGVLDIVKKEDRRKD